MKMIRKLTMCDKGHIIDTIRLMKEKYIEACFNDSEAHYNPILCMNKITYNQYLKETMYYTIITKKYKMPNDMGYGTIYGIPIIIDSSISPGVLILREEEKDMGYGKPIPFNSITINTNMGYINHTNKLPERYITNKNAVILFWTDGTKTVVKRSKDDKQDPVKGFLWAYFEHNSGMSKTKTNKYLKDIEKAIENK